MATPLTADALARALRDEGVVLSESGNWRIHNRNSRGAWGPVHGVMLHHTAGTDSLRLCREGTADLPGPLCIGLITKDGTVHLVGYGRTNHAGSGSTAVLEAVRAERPHCPPPDRTPWTATPASTASRSRTWATGGTPTRPPNSPPWNGFPPRSAAPTAGPRPA